jgi:glucosylceramidase
MIRPHGKETRHSPRAGRASRPGAVAILGVALPLVLGHGCGEGATAAAPCPCGDEGPPPTSWPDAGVPIGPGFVASQWRSSESCPFSLASPNGDWFACPHPIAHRLDRGPDLPITAPGSDVPTRIDVNPSIAYQSILGTGISIEEASVANLLALSAAKRTEVLRRMLDPVDGAGMNLFRVTMGTSDFTGRPWYTYDDVPLGGEDPSLDHFSIQKDIDYGIVSVLKEMLAMSPGILFFASPWSPPAWMKDNAQITGGLFGGSLLTDKIPILAAYFRRFVEAYRAQGVPIYAVTLQNEPLATSPFMPTCLVSAAQEAQLAKAVKQELTAAGLDTRVWIYDQNFDVGVDYARGVFGDLQALAAADGTAFHDYAGDPSAMSTLHALYPQKDIFFTEKTLWGVAGMDRAAQYFRNWARSYVAWVTMLDQDGLPNNGPNSEKPRRFVRSISYAGDAYYPTPEYYLFALFSRFVAPGAVRIESTYGSADTVTNVAFRNPDGTIAAVVINQTATVQPFALLSEGNQIWATLDAKTAGAIVWRQGLGKSTAPPVRPGG